MTRKRKAYVDNQKLFEEVVAYNIERRKCVEEGIELPIIPKYVGEAIYKIVNRLATRPNFSGYSFKEEMISDALENLIQAVPKFDENKTQNPFSYFTTIAWYAFLRRIEKEKRYLYTKHKFIEQSMIDGTLIDKDPSLNGAAAYVDINTDYMNDFVKTYEEKMQKGK
jgi:DNA-directed RNA polymerase specialized sigma24 family protein